MRRGLLSFCGLFYPKYVSQRENELLQAHRQQEVAHRHPCLCQWRPGSGFVSEQWRRALERGGAVVSGHVNVHSFPPQFLPHKFDHVRLFSASSWFLSNHTEEGRDQW